MFKQNPCFLAQRPNDIQCRWVAPITFLFLHYRTTYLSFVVSLTFSKFPSVSTKNGAHCIKTTKSPSVVVAESHNITSQWSHKIRTDSMGYHRITISNKKLYKITKESSIVGDQSCLRSELINQLIAQAVWPPVTEIWREIVTNRVAGGLNP